MGLSGRRVPRGALPRLFVALAALQIAAGGTAAQQEASSPTPVPAVESTPRPAVSAPEIAARIDETTGVLLRIERSLEGGPRLDGIRAELPAVKDAIEERAGETPLLVEQGATTRALDYLAVTWQGLRTLLDGWGRELTAGAVALEGAVQELGRERDLWKASRSQAVDAAVPPELLARIDETMRAIDRLQERVGRRRNDVLVLQNQVAGQFVPVDRALAQLAEARLARVGRLLERDSPPLWRLGRTPNGADLVAGLRTLVTLKLREARDWLDARRGGIALHLLLLGTLWFLFRQVSRRAREDATGRADEAGAEHDEVGRDDDGAPADRAGRHRPGSTGRERILELPLSCAIVTALLASRLIGARPPDVVDQAFVLVAFVPTVRLLLLLVPTAAEPAVIAVAAFFLVDLGRELIVAAPTLERLFVVAEIAAGCAFFAWLALSRSERAVRTLGTLRLPRPGRIAGFALLALLAALLAAVAGYMELARLLAGAVRGGLYLGAVLWVGARIAESFGIAALGVPPVSRLNVARRHRPLIEQWIRRLVLVAALALWVVGVLRELSLGPVASEFGRDLLATNLGPGAIRLTIGDLLAFALTVAATVLLSRFARFFLEEELFRHVSAPRGIPYAVTTVLQYAILGGGFALALGALGIDLNRFTILAGAFGVGIGFGLQNIVNNFVSGLILLFERPIQVGDEIQVGDVVGIVRRIGVRSSTVRTARGADVIVPNGTLLGERVTNWTRDRIRRLEVGVSVGYGAEPERVVELLREAARSHPAIVADPRPMALLVRFDATAMVFELRAWTSRRDQAALVASELHLRVHAALRAAGLLPTG